VTAFLVPGDAVSARRPIEMLGVRTAGLAEIDLDGVAVGDEAVLGVVGGGAAVFGLAMEWERSLVAACHVGAMERLLDHATARARTHRRFGHAIGKNQAVSHALADMKARLESARLLVYRAAWRLAQGERAGVDASLAKLVASESLVVVARSALAIGGGDAYAAGSEAERALRDAIGSTIYSGTSDIQRNVIAGWMGL
jgi:alkylation response protein AidB-like acyl-CoA dehydrogenase